MYSEKMGHVRDYLHLRPFPQNIKDPDKCRDLYNAYREDMLGGTGVSIFIFGNKMNDDEVVDAPGCIQEFEIAKDKGHIIIPIGSTGYAARKIYGYIINDISNYAYLTRYIDQLGTETEIETIINIVMEILKEPI